MDKSSPPPSKHQMAAYCCPAPDHGEPSRQTSNHPLLSSPLSFLRHLAKPDEGECADRSCDKALPCDGLAVNDEGQGLDCCFDLGCPETITCSSPECDIPSCPTLDICTDVDCTLPIAPPLLACKGCGEIPRPLSTPSSSETSSLAPFEPSTKRVTHVQPNGEVLECSCSHHTSWETGTGQLTDQDFDDFLECCNAHLGPFPAIPLETPIPSLEFANSRSSASSLSPAESPNPSIDPSSTHLQTNQSSDSSTPLDALLSAALASFTLPSSTLGSQTDSSYTFPTDHASQNQYLSALYPDSSTQHASPTHNQAYGFNAQPFQQRQQSIDSSDSHFSTFNPSFQSFNPTPSSTHTPSSTPSRSSTLSMPPVPCEWNDCGESFPTLEQLVEHFRSSSSHIPIDPQLAQQQQQSYSTGSMMAGGGQRQVQQLTLECLWGGEHHSLDWSMMDGIQDGMGGSSSGNVGSIASDNAQGLSAKDLLLKHLLEDHLGRLQQQQQQQQSRQYLLQPQSQPYQLSQQPFSAPQTHIPSLSSNLSRHNLDPNLFNLHHQQFHQQSDLFPQHDPSTCTFDFALEFDAPSQSTTMTTEQSFAPTHHHHYGTVHQSDITHSHSHGHDHLHHDHQLQGHSYLQPHSDFYPSTTQPHPASSTSSATLPPKPLPLKPSSRASFSTPSTSASSSSASQVHPCGYPGCTLSFPSTDALTKHLDAAHVGSGKNSYTCEWEGCERGATGPVFKSKQKIMRHLQSHTGHKPFICTICNQAFSEAATLQQHHRRHTNEKPFACDHAGCTKTFSLAASLTIHKRTHDVKPFQCPHCDKAFVEASNLTKHIRTHTGERPFPCLHPGCDKRFARSDQLARHQGVHDRKEAKTDQGR